MIYEIKQTNQAQLDLRNIYEYIAFTLNSPYIASSLLDRLDNSINSLSEMPERFHLYDKEPWRSRNLRVMYVDSYLVFYVFDNIKKQ